MDALSARVTRWGQRNADSRLLPECYVFQGGKRNRKPSAGVFRKYFCVWFAPCFAVSLPFSSLHLFSLSHTHTETSKHTHFYLLVTRCQQEQVEGTLPHAEPSVCCCLSPYHARYTAYQYSKAETNKHSAAISRRQIRLKHLIRGEITAKNQTKTDCEAAEQLTSLLASAFFSVFSGSVIKKMFISSPELLLPL